MRARLGGAGLCDRLPLSPMRFPAPIKTDYELAELKPFPEIERRNRLPSDAWRKLYFSLANRELAYRFANRRYAAAARRLTLPALTPAATRVADDLDATGIAFADWSDFFDPGFLETLGDRFQAFQDVFTQTMSPKTRKGKSTYMDTIYKFHTFVPDDAVSDYLGDPAFAGIAARYLGMVPRFTGANFWRTRPAEGADRTYSQLWHRDYNDRALVKVFLYITDVGPKEGFFEFISGSHGRGPLGRLYDEIGADGYREYPKPGEAEQMVAGLPVVELNAVPASQRSGPGTPWRRQPTHIRCLAPRGTLIFCDTFGLHRGGYVEQGHRDMIMAIYSTNFNVHKPQYAVARAYAERLTPFMRMALGVD
jgi:hypothetical protein